MATATKTRKPARKPLTEAQKAERAAAKKARIAAMEAAVEEFDAAGEDGELTGATALAFEALTAHYSQGNATLILAQAAQLGLDVRGLNDVGGYGAFQERGRQVRKGEHQTLFVWARVERRNADNDAAPADGEKVIETTDADGKKTRVRYVPQGLFHISQTDPK